MRVNNQLSIIILLLATCCGNILCTNLQHGMHGRVRIADAFNTNFHSQHHQTQTMGSSSTINLPTGFNPPPPPVNPLHYPFHTPTPRPTWKPLMRRDNTTRRTIPITSAAPPPSPLLEDRISLNDDDVQFIVDAHPVPAETVYGHPKPNESVEVSGVMTVANVPNERPVSSLEAMLIGLHGHQLDHIRANEEKHTRLAASLKTADQAPKTLGRQKINQTNTSVYAETPAVITLKSTDPKFQQIAQQINKSEETQKYPLEAELAEQEKATGNWMPMVPNKQEYEMAIKRAIQRIISKTTVGTTTQSSFKNEEETPMKTTSTTTSTTTTKTVSQLTTSAMPVNEETTTTTTTSTTSSTTAAPMNWPADFMLSTPYPLDTSSNPTDSISYEGDTAEIPNYFEELNIAESLGPQLAVNITRVGIPYEEKNSAEEPTICVPLTVSETMQTNLEDAPEVIEVERVYCFPLPLPELKVKVATTSSQPTMSTEIASVRDEQTPQKKSADSGQRRHYAIGIGWCLLLYTLIKLL